MEIEAVHTKKVGRFLVHSISYKREPNRAFVVLGDTLSHLIGQPCRYCSVEVDGGGARG